METHTIHSRDNVTYVYLHDDGIFPNNARLPLLKYRAAVAMQGRDPAEVQAGDVAVVPAGVAHKRLHSSGDFSVVGAYPVGQTWDMCYGREGERPGTDQVIAAVPLPYADPVHGRQGPLLQLWSTY